MIDFWGWLFCGGWDDIFGGILEGFIGSGGWLGWAYGASGI